MSHAATLAPAWTCGTCGAGLDDACPQPDARCRIDAELVVARLEAAGATLLAMRTRSPYPAPYRCALPDVLREVIEGYGWDAAEYHPPVPSSAAITAMDATWKWLAHVPQHRFVLRRIVAARSLVHPLTGRHAVHWRPLGKLLHCSHEAARTWHGQGIALIVAGLRG